MLGREIEFAHQGAAVIHLHRHAFKGTYGCVFGELITFVCCSLDVAKLAALFRLRALRIAPVD
jgi:hypothetical protein